MRGVKPNSRIAEGEPRTMEISVLSQVSCTLADRQFYPERRFDKETLPGWLSENCRYSPAGQLPPEPGCSD
jgi:hypothetical protein